MIKKGEQKAGYRKISFDITEENYDYLINMSKNINIKVGPFLNVILERLRMNDMDSLIIDETIKIIEKNIYEQSLLLEELRNFKTTINLI